MNLIFTFISSKLELAKVDNQVMIVCQCKGITDRGVREAVRSGARTPADVGIGCAAGTDCGGCRVTIELIIRAELGRDETEPATDRRLLPVAS